MKLSRLHTYFAILAAAIFICLLYQSIWIFSRTTTAKVYAVSYTKGRNNTSWMRASYQVDYNTYYGSFLRDGYDISDRNFKVRYLVFDPDLARSDTFASNWGPDEGSLIFSSRGFIYKNEKFYLENIESAVVYLESFRGFEYRDRITTGRTNTISDGDNNKISVRYKGEVMDFTFILNTASDYWAFKKLMGDWSVKGVNVFMQKVFEDEFMIQEETHFHS